MSELSLIFSKNLFSLFIVELEVGSQIRPEKNAMSLTMCAKSSNAS